MTHLEAFLSDDAKNGRVWTDGCSNYKRHYSQLWIDAHKDGAWKFYDEQVAAMDDNVTWLANEPKTLTPQEALRALADGKCIACSATPYRLGRLGMEYWSPMQRWVSNDFHFGEITGRTWRECSDPSQPAEPKRDWNLFGPYEDMPADIQRDIKTERGHAKAEPQVEYPKSSCSCMGDASCPCRRNK